MTNQSLARSYLVKAQKRLKALAVLRDEGGPFRRRSGGSGTG